MPVAALIMLLFFKQEVSTKSPLLVTIAMCYLS